MKNFALFTLIIFNSHTCAYSQEVRFETPKDSVGIGISHIELEWLKNAFVEMQKTQLYLDYENKNKLFAKKVGAVLLKANSEIISNKETFIPWLKENFNQTNFQSIEEAEQIMNNMLISYQKVRDENKRVYSLLSKATKPQRLEIKRIIQKRVVYSNGN